MEPTMFGGTIVSSWSFRLTGTMLVLMVPIFLMDRFTHLTQQAASTALGALGIGAGVAVVVGTIAAIWKK
jgi:hypothetical protein